MSDFQGGIALMSNGAVNQDSSYMSVDAAYALMARAALIALDSASMLLLVRCSGL